MTYALDRQDATARIRPGRSRGPTSVDVSPDTVDAEFDERTNVGRLTLNRPDTLNALSDQLRRDIVGGLQWLESHNEDTDDIALRAVVEGAAGNFCAGADIS